MSIFAANCPCCGRDIGFDESAKEYTCIFCGAKLITATLVKERLDSTHQNAGYERYRKGDHTDAEHSGRRQGASWHGPVKQEAQPAPSEQPQKAEEKPAEEEPHEEEKHEELTEEQIRVQLMRKAEFKQELRDTVKEIDNLRSKRERFTSQLKTCKLLMWMGLSFIGIAAVIAIMFGDKEGGVFGDSLMVALALAILGIVALILSEVKKNGVKKQQKKHEQTIEEKKEKRDILIGRLNKINKRLHIHDDD